MPESASATLNDVKSPAPKETAKTPGLLRRAVESLKRRVFPDYTKSLLRIQVPVVVTLAEKRQQLGRVLELGPGMIIQFDKSCDEMLDLEVGSRKIAQGEVVKVGDKFGLKVSNIILPGERFLAMKKG
jgi:flagellar motor switch protein FliN